MKLFLVASLVSALRLSAEPQANSNKTVSFAENDFRTYEASAFHLKGVAEASYAKLDELNAKTGFNPYSDDAKNTGDAEPKN